MAEIILCGTCGAKCGDPSDPNVLVIGYSKIGWLPKPTKAERDLEAAILRWRGIGFVRVAVCKKTPDDNIEVDIPDWSETCKSDAATS